MSKIIKNIRIKSVVTLFLLATLILFIPGSLSLGQIYECDSVIKIDYDKDFANKPILPINRTLTIPIKTRYFIQGFLAEYVGQEYTESGIYAYVYPEVIKTPEWCVATVTPSFLLLPATTDGVEKILNLTIKINRNARAFDEGKISLRFNISQMGSVRGASYIKNVSFTTGYLPMLDINILDGTLEYITPSEIANFGIEIKNLGNAKTYVSARILDIPKGWSANIPSDFLIESKNSGGDNTKTITFSVKPPYTFGYHNDKKTITVALKPSYFDNKTISGGEYYINFIVKSKGFSTPGFEFILVTLSLCFMVILARRKYYLDRRNKD